MNRVLIAGRLTRDPEMRKLASGKTVTQFGVATNDYRAGSEKAEYHNVVTWVCRTHSSNAPGGTLCNRCTILVV